MNNRGQAPGPNRIVADDKVWVEVEQGASGDVILQHDLGVKQNEFRITRMNDTRRD